MITDATFVNEFYYGYRSRLINVYCYDENKNLLESKMFKLRHGMLKAPEGTKYLKLCVPIMTQLGEELINKGNSDFNNCIFAIKFMNEAKNIKFENCNISNNYSCGMALSGYNITIDGCTFNNNIGRMPWCDIDCEDGWVRMQNITFRNNKFQSHYGLIMCAGQNFVFKNNDNYYYVPVTNVDNSSNEKIEIIIDELSKGPNMDNLMSFLNINTKLLNYEIKEKQMVLTFNEDILSSIEDKSILEEVINTINYSIDDNYDVNEVVFRVGEEEILKNVLKTLD